LRHPNRERAPRAVQIDSYDRNLAYHSPDPSDPKVTERVLTVMLASEY